MGLSSTEKLIEVQRADLVSDHIGGTSKRTTAIIEKAMGGVLFIDEAYTLSSGSEKDFGKEAIETLMSFMNENPEKSVKYPTMIFAGYPDQMDRFMSVNPGLERRLKQTITFEDYTCEELSDIVNLKLLGKNIRFPLNVDKKLAECYYEVPSLTRSKHNAALCDDLIESIQTAQEARLDPETVKTSELFIFTDDDVEKGIANFVQGFSKNVGKQMVSVGSQTGDVILNIPNIGIVFSSP